MIYGLIMIFIGLVMFTCAVKECEHKLFQLLIARSKMVWKDNVYNFYKVSGILIVLVGILVMFNII